MDINHGFAEVDGARLYYEVAGEGHPLVLNCACTLDTRMWDDQFEAFAQHYRVIRYYLRTCGQSSDSIGQFTHHDDLKTLLRSLRIEKAHVLGLSIGGGIAINFALHYPEATSSLIPVDSFLTGFDWPQMLPLLKEMIDAVDESNSQEAKRLWMAMPWFKPALQIPTVASRLTQMVSDNWDRHYHGSHKQRRGMIAWGQRPMTEGLSEIQAPTLAIVGELDTDDNHVVTGIICKEVPNARKAMIPGAGHMTNMESPDKFNKAVLDFLAQL